MYFANPIILIDLIELRTAEVAAILSCVAWFQAACLTPILNENQTADPVQTNSNQHDLNLNLNNRMGRTNDDTQWHNTHDADLAL